MRGEKPELSGADADEFVRRMASELIPRSDRPPYLVVASVVDDIAEGIAGLEAGPAESGGFRAGLEAAARYVRGRAAVLRDLAERPGLQDPTEGGAGGSHGGL